MPVPQRDWIDFVYALAPAIAALIAVGVGLMQYYLQREQAKLQLYDTRFAVYTTLVTNYFQLVHVERFDNKDWGLSAEFYDISYHCPFLFGKDVAEFLRRLTLAVREYQTKWAVYRQEMLLFEGRQKAFPTIPLDCPQKPSTEVLPDPMEIRSVFSNYFQLHHDAPWIVRLNRRIDRWMDSEVPAKLATRYNA
jgi:hypothetical protein